MYAAGIVWQQPPGAKRRTRLAPGLLFLVPVAAKSWLAAEEAKPGINPGTSPPLIETRAAGNSVSAKTGDRTQKTRHRRVRRFNILRDCVSLPSVQTIIWNTPGLRGQSSEARELSSTPAKWSLMDGDGTHDVTHTEILACLNNGDSQGSLQACTPYSSRTL
ncbi:hypothetical protein Bbelb_197010 [Branchiostoma belcheri]|nr:hypothetical protein Bbelb_197010 [Branchiostoma belcheri]